jgi:hypothetical protein
VKQFGIARNLPRKPRRSRRGGRNERRSNQAAASPASDSSSQLLVCAFNAQALGQSEKRTAICTFIADNDVDVMLLSETWLRSSGDEAKLKDLAPPGYSVQSFARDSLGVSGRGGGIALVIKDCLRKHATFTQSSLHHPSFEAAVLTVSLNGTRINIACVYRPPPSKKNKLTNAMFFLSISGLFRTL